ncbi:hypothetical protein Tco_0734971 [Tanacetum coccineum]
MLCYLTGMEPCYIQCIKDGPFKPKTAKGVDKPESQYLKSITISCLSDDIIESVISCETVKSTWTDLVYSFEGPSDTKQNRIIDLKLEYQTFRAKPSESLSQTNNCYKTLLNELANDGVALSKHEINFGFMNSLPEKFVYEDNLISRRYSDTKKALITTPSNSPISTAFFFNNIVQDFQENSDDEADERSCEEYLRDLELDEQEVSDDKEETQVKVLIALADDEISAGKNHARNDEWIDITMKKGASPSSESVLGLVTVSDTEPVTSLVPTKVKTNDQESKIDDLTKLKSKPNGKNPDSSKPVRPKLLQKPKLKCELCNYTNHSTDDCYRILYYMKCKKEDHRTSDHDMYISSLKCSQNYKAQPYKYASPSKQILKSKAKPYLPCTHCSFNDHCPDDCTNYPECEICGSYDHFTLGHNHVILVRRGVLVESSQSSEFVIRVSCTTCGSNVHSTTDHNNFEHFKRCEKLHATKAKDPIKKFLHKYVKQPGLKVVFGDNSSCITEGYNSINCGGIIFSKQGTIFNANKEIVLIAPRRNDVYVLDMSSLTPNGACFFAKASESVNWLWINHVLHVKKESIKEPLLKLNKTSLSRKKCLRLLHMDLFGPVSPMSINHEKYTLFIVDKYSRSIIVKRHDKNPYEIFRERIHDTSYFHVFGCPVFIHNHKDHLVKFDVKADGGYFLGYSFNSKAFKVFNTRRQQIKETNHVTFYKSMKAIRFINTSIDEIGIDDSSRYPPDEFAQEDDPSRQYQSNFDFSYFIIPHGHSLTELTQESHVPKVIAPNE